jgi:virulence-associated protein VagC
METATVIVEGDRQTVRLPKSVHLPTPTVSVRREGEAVVLEPLRPAAWSEEFFDSIRIDDPAVVRPPQGQLPPVKSC